MSTKKKSSGGSTTWSKNGYCLVKDVVENGTATRKHVTVEEFEKTKNEIMRGLMGEMKEVTA